MPYSPEQRQAALAVVESLRARSVCARCGQQPIDWHGAHHKGRESFRPWSMAARGVPLDRVLADIARCTPLCRRCHMREDGRTKLDDAARADIRSSPLSGRELAAYYGVSRKTVEAIRRNPSYPDNGYNRRKVNR